jgi:3-oxoacyl-[acyl-carrier-protein] synthase-3
MGTVGIVSVGTYLPSALETSREMSEKSGFPEHVFTDRIGIREKRVAAPDEHPSDLGIKAALDAIERAQIDPTDIDIVLFCGCALYDYGVWSPSARVQHEIGATDALAIELKNGCNGANLGMHMAGRYLLADPDLEYALVVCADTLSRLVNYSDEKLISIFSNADGGTAAVLRKNHPGNRILSHFGMSDGKLVDAVHAPLGGTRVPPNTQCIDGRITLKIDNPEQLANVFTDIYLKNYVRVVHEALARSGYSVDDIDFLFTNQMKKSTQQGILAALGLSPEQTCRTMENFGHMGASDTLFGLRQMQDAGRIDEGDVVVMASSSLGFHWGATVVQF